MPQKFSLLKVLLLSFFVVFLIAIISYGTARKQSLNLIIISIDTLRADHMGVYGYSRNTTPNIDQWAKDATVFTNATTMVPMTRPSLVSLMTGRNPLKTRIITNQGLPLSWNTKTLAVILKDYGYITGAFLPYGNYANDKTGIYQGFDEIKNHVYKYYYYKNAQERYGQNEAKNYEKFVGEALSWLQRHKNKKKFLWVHLLDPHAPYYPPENLRCKFNQKYCNAILGKTLDELDEQRAKYQECQTQEVPKNTLETMETLYDGGVAYSDRLVGKILNKLKETGLDKNTLVVLYADHGEGFDHNYYFNHREVLYDSAIKIPLIIKDPLIKSGKKSNRLIENADILPALLDLLGLPQINPKVDGISFVDEFSNNFITKFIARKRNYSYSINSTWTKFSIFDGKYKYVYSLPESCLLENQIEELYNLQNDHRETKNLIKKKKEVAKKLKIELFQYLSPYNLPLGISTQQSSILHLENENKDNNLQNGKKEILEQLQSLGY